MLKENAYELLINYLETTIKSSEELLKLKLQKGVEVTQEWCDDSFSHIHQVYNLYVVMCKNEDHDRTYFARMGNIKTAWKIERV